MYSFVSRYLWKMPRKHWWRSQESIRIDLTMWDDSDMVGWKYRLFLTCLSLWYLLHFCFNNEIHEKLFSLSCSLFTDVKISWEEYINCKYINDFFNKRSGKARGTEPQETFNHCIIHSYCRKEFRTIVFKTLGICVVNLVKQNLY